MIAASRVRAPAADIDRGPRDRAGGGHAAEQGRDDVGKALTEQLAVGIVPLGVGHAVGDLGREQALDRGQRGDGERGRDQRLHLQNEVEGRDGAGSEFGSEPIRAISRCMTSAMTVAARTAIKEAGKSGSQSRPRRP